MLFPYKQVPHQMRYMQYFVNYIFNKVWCKAPNNVYSVELYKGMPKLYTLMNEFSLQDMAGKLEKDGKPYGAAGFFYKNVNEIFNEFQALQPTEIAKLQKYFSINNNIRVLCEGGAQPLRYKHNETEALKIKIKSFFSNLYSSGFFKLKSVVDIIGSDLHGHYREFARKNGLVCCPFCGLQPMDNEYDPTREAYDHYLPASKYPFNSVSLNNLAPSCYKCNSQNKGDKDPLKIDDTNPSRAFYPYTRRPYGIAISLNFLCENRHPANTNEIEVELSCHGYEQELETWDQLYNIRDRYAAKCCSSRVSKAWLNRIKIECKNYGRSPEEALEVELLACNEEPWFEAAFLKSAYLQESQSKGLFTF